MKKLMYLIAYVPLFAAAIALLMLGIVTFPLLVLARIVSLALPSDFAKRFFRAAQTTYMLPAYCLRDAGVFIDDLFRKWTNANN